MARALALLVVLLAALAVAADAAHALRAPRRTVSSSTQITAVQGLISRFVSKSVAAAFDLEIIPQQDNKDVMKITPLGKGRIQLSGSNGVSLAAAFHMYLKTAVNAMITWNQTQINISTPLPQVGSTMTFVTPYTFRYYYNVCTFGYSAVWWQWDRWQRELDWAAMNAINLPLAMVGQEAVWQQVYTQLGFNETDLAGFFTGPAYLPWNRMGNVYGWQGPLSQNWIDSQKALQLQILGYMRAIGMTPVLPGFAGHVPYTFSARYPNSNVTMLSPWNSFPGTAYLDPQDAMYQTIGTLFIEVQTGMYGTDHFYACDPFNEVEPATNDPTWLAASGKAIYNAMYTADPYAVWVMQGWFLFNAASFWQPPQAQAFLTAAPVDGLLMLDLFAEVSPVWNRTDSFYGRNFVWCMLHNFGGRTGMYATLPSVASGPAGALAATEYAVGIGMTPEAIETNYITYDLLTTQIWMNTTVDLSDYVPDFATRRYGIAHPNATLAWTLLQQSVFNCIPEVNICHGTVPSLAARRPSFLLTNLLYYEPVTVVDALFSLLSAAPTLGAIDMYQYDLAELTRQALVNVHITLYYALINAYNAGDLASVQGNSSAILSLMADLDTLVGTRREWLLGTWVSGAIALASSPEEAQLFELNARNQLTLWGYPTSDLYDYAGKLWNGLIADFYIPRWTLFLQQVADSVQFNYSFPLLAFEDQIITYEQNWVIQHKVYPTSPIGSTLAVANQLIAKWRALLP